MRTYRPTIVLVVAILQICFGTLGLLGGVCGTAFQLAGGNKMFMPPAGAPGGQAPAADIEGRLKAKIPYYEAMQYGGLALSVVAGTVMLAGGIGLLKMLPWARRLTIGYAGYYILSSVIGFIFDLVVAVPLIKEFVAEERAKPGLPPQAAMVLSWTETGATLGPYLRLVLLAYPAFLLIAMFLPDVRLAFRRRAEKPVAEDADEDWSDDESEMPPEEGIEPREG